MKYMENEKLNEISSELSEAVLKDSHRVIHGRIEAYTMKRAGTDKKYAHALGQKYIAEIEDMQEELAATVERKRRRRSNSESILTTSGRRITNDYGTSNKKAKSSFLNDSSSSSSSKEAKRARSRSFDCTLDSISPKTTLGDFSEISTRKLMTDLILTLNASFPDYDFSNVKANQFQKLNMSDVRKSIRQNLSEFASQRSSPNFLEELWNAVNDVIELKESNVYSFDYEFADDDDSANNSLWSFHYLFVNKSVRRIVFFTCSERISEDLMLGGQQSHDEVDGLSERVEYYGRDALHTPVDDVDWDPSDNIAGGMSLEVTIGG
jgi:molybdenum-dependent DNA-binding transcriptional regulator ModE